MPRLLPGVWERFLTWYSGSKITSADFDSLLDQVHLGIAGLSLTSSSGSLNNARNFINYLDSKDLCDHILNLRDETKLKYKIINLTLLY